MEMKENQTWEIFKSDTIAHFHQKILKYANDFQYQNFLVL